MAWGFTVAKANWRKFIGNRAQNYCLLLCIKVWSKKKSKSLSTACISSFPIEYRFDTSFQSRSENDLIWGFLNKRDGNVSELWKANRGEKCFWGKMCTRLKITPRPAWRYTEFHSNSSNLGRRLERNDSRELTFNDMKKSLRALWSKRQGGSLRTFDI